MTDISGHRAAFALTLGLLPALPHAAWASSATVELPLLPRPAIMSTQPGFFFMPASLDVVVDGVDALTATRLCDTMRAPHGPVLMMRDSGAAPARAAIRMRLLASAASAPAEGYELAIGHDGIVVTAHDQAGLFYGAVSVSQLLGAGRARLPGMHVRDWPRLQWRGVMLDSSRHFQTPAEVRSLIDAMAELKLNVLHWHLTDDQGWRLEIRRYPELTRVGAWRRAPDSGPNGDGASYGGFYTQAEIRDIVAYAAARQITIVPELDMPGHAQAAIAAYPKVGSGGTPTRVSSTMGVHPYLYNVNEETFAFIDHILDEVMELFPSRFIHIGGDEAVKTQWQHSPAVQARMRELGIHDEEALQSWFIERLGKYLSAHGRRLIGWDEILKGGLPASASVMSWHGTAGAVTAAQAGHDAVMAPSDRLYFDYMQTDRDDEPTGGRYPVESLSTVYHFDPLPPGMPPSVQQHILGVEGGIWTEYLTSGRATMLAAFPRLDAMAETAWTPHERQDWDSFRIRLKDEVTRQLSRGVPVDQAAYAVSISAIPDQAGHYEVTLSNQIAQGTLHYTLDGREPDAQAPAYVHPLTVGAGTKVRAAAFDAGGLRLAPSSTRVISVGGIATRSGTQLAACEGGRLSLRIPATPDATATAPYLTIDRTRDCVMYGAPPPQGASTLAIRVVPVTHFFNTPLDDGPRVPVMKLDAPRHAISVWPDRCTGKPVATTRLPRHPRPGVPLDISLPVTAQGAHDLCIAVPDEKEPLYYAFQTLSLTGQKNTEHNK
ncbi:beta-N-acetylhexosaminidase [Novacetimonas cocois]|nr:family 20 glycosylhydrolase [Novacetimonas cocois]